MTKRRLFLLKILIVIMLLSIVWRLYNMQVINGEGYKNLSNQRVSANIVEKAPRGEITDRNGKALVTNRRGYSLRLQKTGMSDDDFNAMLLRLFNILDGEGYQLSDTLPISAVAPYEFIFSGKEEEKKWFSDNSLKVGMTADDVLNYYKERYNAEKIPENELRRLIGMRYDIRKSGFSINSSYILASDVPISVVSKVKERGDEFQGISVTQDYFREYTSGKLAAHILGRVGKIYKEEYAELKEKGYSISDVVGKQGIEKICESYLRGENGTKSAFYGKDKELLKGETEREAVPGDYVVLTIDSELQRVAEESLERNIKQIAAAGAADGRGKRGEDAKAGAAVVIDVNTGEILASATYPSYSPETFSADYESLSEDDAKPLWNRAISGTYTPGSTFKPLTAIAALSTGAITANEQITCEGVYKFYEDYQPKCWIWSEQHLTHGPLNVSQAIVESCNYFFYETGRRTGIDAISEYAKKFGLGEKTGIELAEEIKGNVSSPEYKKTLYKDEKEKRWVAGDTIQTAIGQSYSAFTPLSLANYVATIANGGNRYKAHIIKSVRSAKDGAVVYEEKPIVIENVNVSEDILKTVKNGMLGVTDEGSAKQIFEGYPINVGGKTGTAQISKKSSNNALFVSFAPFDKPEIAVAVIIEHGYRGANAAYVARDIFDEYFGLNRSAENQQNTEISTENTALLP